MDAILRDQESVSTETTLNNESKLELKLQRKSTTLNTASLTTNEEDLSGSDLTIATTSTTACLFQQAQPQDEETTKFNSIASTETNSYDSSLVLLHDSNTDIENGGLGIISTTNFTTGRKRLASHSLINEKKTFSFEDGALLNIFTNNNNIISEHLCLSTNEDNSKRAKLLSKTTAKNPLIQNHQNNNNNSASNELAIISDDEKADEEEQASTSSLNDDDCEDDDDDDDDELDEWFVS